MDNNLAQINNKKIKIVLIVKGLRLLHKNIKLKKKFGNNNVFRYVIKNGNKNLPHTYSNGFCTYNKRLPSPMISGQKLGMTQKTKFNNYRLSLTNSNIFSFKSKKSFG